MPFSRADAARCGADVTLCGADITLLRPCCSAKSTVAAEAALAINPALRVRALQNRVSPDTEDVFDDAFWGSLDMVVRALTL